MLKSFPQKLPVLKRRRHSRLWRLLFKLAKIELDGFFSQPVRQLEIFSDFAPFVTMLHGFFRMIIRFSEGILRVPNGFIDDFYCSRHSLDPFSKWEHSVNSAKGLPWTVFLALNGHCRLQAVLL
jgi:hypothetical protein